MAGEARFHTMNGDEQKNLQTALAPFLSADTPVELWYLAPKRKDDGQFAWCVSPAEAEGDWVLLGTLPVSELQLLAKQTTAVEHGQTYDYWQTYQLRSGQAKRNIQTCPAQEFGVHIDGCSAVRAREFHKAVWKLIDKKYDIQKRFDVVVRS